MQKLLSELSEAKETKVQMVAKAELLQQELNKLKKAIDYKSLKDANQLVTSLFGGESRRNNIFTQPKRKSIFDSLPVPRLEEGESE